MKIAKEFRWEMGHRLPYHNGKCRNLHGHSYKLLVEFEGHVDPNGMVMDYYDVKEVIVPLVDELDHAFLVYQDDTDLVDAIMNLDSKIVIVNYHTTAENICIYFLEKIKSSKLPQNIKKIKVKVFETETTYAEEELILE